VTVAVHNDPDNLPEQRAGGNLEVRPGQTQWDDNQRAALVHLGIADASPGDQQVFLHYCQRTQLDPFSKQIYMIKRGGKWTMQTAIDGFRVIANRRPEYGGQTGPEWCGEDGVWRDVWVDRKPPTAARVGVIRTDWAQPIYMTAMFREFNQGGPKWASDGMPAHMLAKCAEAGALRKAFPHDLGGIYTDDELGAAEHAPRRRVVIAQAPAAPVTGNELRGSTPATEPVSEPATAAPNEGSDRMSTPQQRKLFALLRESDIDDRHDWATRLLGREITSFGQLSPGDAARLIDNLEEAQWAQDVQRGEQ
jgi:phage recombination protein Bet